MPCRQKVSMIITLKNAEECGSGVAVLLLCLRVGWISYAWLSSGAVRLAQKFTLGCSTHAQLGPPGP